jgi:hypothetical protein
MQGISDSVTDNEDLEKDGTHINLYYQPGLSLLSYRSI